MLGGGGATTVRPPSLGPWGVPILVCGVRHAGTHWLRTGAHALLWAGNAGLATVDPAPCANQRVQDSTPQQPFESRTGNPHPSRPSFRLAIPVDDPAALPDGTVAVKLVYHIRRPPGATGWVGARVSATIEHGSRTADMVGGTGRLRYSIMYVDTDRLRAEGQLVVSGTMQLLGGNCGDRFTLDMVEILA